MVGLGDYADNYWKASDDLRLYARDYNSGALGKLPIVCLAGLTRSSCDFRIIAPRMAALGRRVICVDLRGRGESGRDTNAANYRIPIYVSDIHRLFEALKITRALFFGTSLGGRVTMSFAAHHPELVGGAIINDIGVQIETVGLDRIVRYMASLPTVTTWDEAEEYCRKFLAPALRDGFDDWPEFVGRTFRARSDGSPEFNYDRRITPGPGTTDMGALTADQSFEALGRCGPILVLRGERSDILSVEEVQRMSTIAPNLVWTQVAGIAHAPQLDEPESIDAITRFLATAP